MPLIRILFCLVALLVAACDRTTAPESPTSLRLDLDGILGEGDAEGFRRADTPRRFEFPRDHGAHPEFRNEWWYLTGNLETPGGRRFGYQVTFFRAALRPPDVDAGEQTPESAWHSDNLWMAHAALTDERGRRHIALERFSRENPGLAGAQTNPFRVWLENWSLATTGEEAAFPWTLEVSDPAFSLRLSLQPAKPLILQGDKGLSRKSPIPGNGSYYYSFTRLRTEGSLALAGQTHQLTGDSWLDREWSTSALAPEQTGWDWFSLQFNDGNELMYYRLLDDRGEALPDSQGSWTDHLGDKTVIDPGDVRFVADRQWQGPDGNNYITQWQLHYGEHAWRVVAVLEDQFMALSLPYWEGAVDVRDMETGEPVGHGYLEMVRE